MSSHVVAHIARAEDLKSHVVALISSWQFDPKTDMFPDSISGETHALGDLEIG